MEEAKSCFAKRPDLVTREIAGETIVVPIRDNVGDLNAVYTLNDTASAIWRHLDGQKSMKQIIDAICDEYDVTPGEAKRDVASILQDLEAASLIELAEQ